MFVTRGGHLLYSSSFFRHGLRWFSLKDGVRYSPPQLHKRNFLARSFGEPANREVPRVHVWCGLHISALLLCSNPCRASVCVCACVRMEPMCGAKLWFHRMLGFDTRRRSLCRYAYIFATKIISFKRKKKNGFIIRCLGVLISDKVCS